MFEQLLFVLICFNRISHESPNQVKLYIHVALVFPKYLVRAVFTCV